MSASVRDFVAPDVTSNQAVRNTVDFTRLPKPLGYVSRTLTNRTGLIRSAHGDVARRVDSEGREPVRQTRGLPEVEGQGEVITS